LLTDPAVDVFVLYLSGAPAGYFELHREAREVGLVRLGVIPEFAGRGVGRYLVAAAVEAAWDHEPDRVWTATTTMDDPQSLLTLQWAGFIPFETVRERREVPPGR
jgi:GNAT superfamily N-acetyltransferase